MNILEIIAFILITTGTIFLCGASIGVLRFPDFYTRMHAAGKGDTLSTIMIMSGLALYNLNTLTWASVLVSLKILGIILFILLTSPTSSHALMQAGHEARIKPWKRDEPKKEDSSC